MRKQKLRAVISDLLAVAEQAIASGDWIPDGACDPGYAISEARKALGEKHGDNGPYWNPADKPWGSF